MGVAERERGEGGVGTVVSTVGFVPRVGRPVASTISLHKEWTV